MSIKTKINQESKEYRHNTLKVALLKVQQMNKLL